MFNTLKYAKKLEGVGITREQAEAHVQIISEIVEGDLATKQDMKDLKDELQKMEYRLVIKLGAIVTALSSAAIAILISVFKH